MFKTFFSNWKRRVAQVISLFIFGEWSFYGIFRCPYAVPYIGCGACPVIQCSGRSLWMWSWVFIGVSALFFGRAFCGWICPGGLLAEIIAAFSFFKNKVTGLVNVIFSSMKYIVLMVSLYYFFILNNPRWAIPIRTGEFFNSVSLTFEHADSIWIYKTAFVIGTFALGLAIPLFWCRFLCPTGGALELLSKLSLFKYSINEKCTDCEQCRIRCSNETRPAEINCSNCGDCQDACTPEAIHIRSVF